MKTFALIAVLFAFVSTPAHAILTGEGGSTVSGTSGVVGAEAELKDADAMKKLVEEQERNEKKEKEAQK